MSTAILDATPLVAGDFLTREEFLERWESCPEIKKAELIGGVVYMAPSVGIEHGHSDMRLITWLMTYVAHTPGTDAANNVTWYMLDDAPQPDSAIWINSQCGGQSFEDGNYRRGGPELAAEISHSSSAYDLHQKLALYEAAGVLEYIAILLREREVRWHRLIDGEYQVLQLPPDGIHRSQTFPGLWLDVAAFWRHDMRCVLQVLQDGLRSPEHEQFVTLLAQREIDRR